MSSATPFIIWTLQRTGGTNLAQRLFERSALLEKAKADVTERPGAHWLAEIPDQWKLHEPFNYGDQGRVFSPITTNWIDTGDRDALRQAIREVCGLGLPMKHCVEMVPWEVTETLAEESVKAGYRHLFLYRQNPVDRLLSLQFAKLSGIWGRHFRDNATLSDRIFAEPLPVEELVEHERICVERLNRVWRRVEHAQPLALSYEELYRAESLEQATALLLTVISALGLSNGRLDDRRFADATISYGDQGTRAAYGAFQGIEELTRALAQLPPFCVEQVGIQLKVRPLWKNASLILHAAIDVVPDRIRLGRMCQLGGVVVLARPAPSAKLFLRSGASREPISWGIRSPAIAERFPAAPNSSSARFRANCLMSAPGAASILELEDGSGSVTKLFRLRVKGAAE